MSIDKTALTVATVKYTSLFIGTLIAVALLAVAAAKLMPGNLQGTGATYHVSPTGNDQKTGKSQDQSFKTLKKALSVAAAGDTVRLADGEYFQDINSVRSGKKGAPITIKGSQNATLYGEDNTDRIVEIHHDYLVLDGFHINGQVGPGNNKKDYRDKLIYAISKKAKKGVEGLKIQNMLLENAGGECVRLRYFARHNEISNTTIRHCGIHDFVFDGGGKNGEGIYIGTAPEQRDDGKNPTTDPDESTENWIHHNTIETHGNECVDVKEGATKNLIEHNTCRFQQDKESGGMDSRGERNIFRYNTISQNQGAGVRLGGDQDRDGIDNDVYSNTITNNKGGALKIMRTPQGKICGNTAEDNDDSADLPEGIDPSEDCE